MDREPMPLELDPLERRLAQRRPEPPAALRQRVLRSVRAELRQEDSVPWGRFAVAAAAVILVWLSLSLTVAGVANSAFHEPHWNPSVVGMAKQLRQISPDFTPEESLREAVLLDLAGEMRSRTNVWDPVCADRVEEQKGAKQGDRQDGPRRDCPPARLPAAGRPAGDPEGAGMFRTIESEYTCDVSRAAGWGGLVHFSANQLDSHERHDGV